MHALKSVLFICTHNLPEAERLCNRVGIIDKGNLIIAGTPKDLIKNKTPDSQIQIHLVEINDDIKSTIYNFKELKELKIDDWGKSISFSIYDPVSIVPTIISDLVKQNDAKILSVYERKKSLEDVYFDYLGRKVDNDN